MPDSLELFVDVNARASGDGRRESPFTSTLEAQRTIGKRLSTSPCDITVWVAPGVYYLQDSFVLRAGDTNPAARITYRTNEPGSATLAGGVRLTCDWRLYRSGIYQTAVPRDIHFDQLFVNGQRQTRARYPNYDPSALREHSGHTLPAGKIPDDEPDPSPADNDDMTFSSGAPRGIYFDPARFSDKRWAHPEDAIIHIFQHSYWGNLQWRIRRIDWLDHRIWFGRGGFQVGAKWAEHPCEVNEHSYFYVENVFEELDSPGEWFLDERSSTLFFYPPADTSLEDAVVEVPQLESIIEMIGSQENPVRNVTFDGFRFALTRSTFLDDYEVPSLSDWAIHRGGAVLLRGTRGCEIRNCHFDSVGGNAVFLDGYNRSATIRNSLFERGGESAVCVVGSLATTVGTQREFPYECAVSNNIVRYGGVFGKQTAGVYISRAKRITVSHNEMHDLPRAGICIGDGTWGGHIIEDNYIHDTCLETSDHGPFNAWGRDKFWCLVQSHTVYTKDRNHFAGNVKVDAMEPVLVRHNFFRERAGWGLDMDDGASNYEIYNNLCVGVSMKLREGAYRNVYNNIWVNGANSPCFHVGNEDNHDRYVRNITVMSVAKMTAENDLNFEMGFGYGEMYTLIAVPARSAWLEECDYNCFFSDAGEFFARVTERVDEPDWKAMDRTKRKYSLSEWRSLGFDRHSVFADPMFVDPEHDDYRVRQDSPALRLGFENFEMHSFGVTEDYPSMWRSK